MHIEQKIYLKNPNKNFTIFKWKFGKTENKDLLNESIDRANKYAKNLNNRLAKDTELIRDENNVMLDAIAGEIACLTWSKSLQQFAKYKNSMFKPEHDKYINGNQIDIYNSSNSKTIEIRSSFVRYKKNIEEILETYSSIGWYSNSVKRYEEKKDFHLQAIFPFPRNNFLDNIDQTFEIYLTGGGDSRLFEESTYAKYQKWGTDSSYRIIKPMRFGFDALECCELITI
tara:strand:- start:1304 stop:1987 length:684 start_codon:yes stop_codon:yes gene_type:complete